MEEDNDGYNHYLHSNDFKDISRSTLKRFSKKYVSEVNSKKHRPNVSELF